MIPIREAAGACTFAIRVQPRARRNEIAGTVGEALKIAVTAPPAKGQANAACIELLAKVLNVPKTSVSIAAAAASRNKLVRVVGVSAAVIRERLQLKTEANENQRDSYRL